MAIGPGVRVGPYEVSALIGQGGMGNVYRAIDTNLKRAVAIKVLPEDVATDGERLARFQLEAEVLARLNHPNIAQIHGLEQSEGVTALVMELVEGPTLADRIAQGRIPIDEARRIATQIADALEAAHEQRIIHRDLKPANIKLRADGTVKVLDFGLAKIVIPDAAAAAVGGLSHSPTVTSAAVTGVGVVLGTVAYMAPEQARGTTVDRRADIWAFGCVLYEMLTGRRAFPEVHVTDTMVSIVSKDPDWSALPSTTPASVTSLLRRCLDKDSKRRLRDIGEARLALEGAFDAVPWSAAGVRVPQWRRLGLAGASGIAAGGLIIGTLVWLAMRPPPPRVMRMTITPTAVAAPSINGTDRDLAITPDGSRIVYIGTNGTQLFVRALDTLESVAIFTGAPRGSFISPDGQWVGFVDSATTLKRLAMTGGATITLATIDGGSRGATWMPDGTVIFGTDNPVTGLQRVSAEGGAPEVLTRPDRGLGEGDHLWPEMVPGGRAVLFTITAAEGGLDGAQIAVLNLQTGTRTVLVRGGSHAQYVPSGHLLYAAAGTLRAVAFDLARLETRGTVVPIIGQVVTTVAGGVNAVVAGDGSLAYMSGPGGEARRTLVWVSRDGQETPILVPPRAYVYPRIAPDGTSVMLFSLDQGQDLWRWDFARTTLTRLTSHGGLDTRPVWTPDGRRVIFTSEQAGPRNLYWQAADGTDTVERLTESPNRQYPAAVSADGMSLIFTEVAPTTGADVMQVQLDGTRRITPLVQTAFNEQNGILSPDGRWLAYEANDSGRFEVYVRTFPDVNGGRWLVSTGGGTRPLWAGSGDELFYLSPQGALMRVGVGGGAQWKGTTPAMLIKEGYSTVPVASSGLTYDISPDGQRFLMIKGTGGSEQNEPPINLVVVQHFDEELKRLVPTP